MGFFILIAGVFFAISNLLSGNPNFTGVLSSLTFIFLFLVPILTMRLISEETRQKTDQLLITSPLSITGIVLGKYLAAVGVFVITLLITVLFPVIMSFFALLGLGWWEILGGYIGFLLLGCAFISVGLFFSSLTDNQLIAAVETFAALLLIWILDFVAQSVPADPVSGLVFLAAPGALPRGPGLLQHAQHAAAAVVTFVLAAAVARAPVRLLAAALHGADREDPRLVLPAEALQRLQPGGPLAEPDRLLHLVLRRVRLPHDPHDRKTALGVREERREKELDSRIAFQQEVPLRRLRDAPDRRARWPW